MRPPVPENSIRKWYKERGLYRSNYLACGSARRKGTCDSRRGITRKTLETIILDALKRDLMQPQNVEEFVRAYHAEINVQAKEQDVSRDRLTAELANVTRKLDGLIDAIAEGLRADRLQQKLDDLEARKQALSEQLNSAPGPMPRLHPNLASPFLPAQGRAPSRGASGRYNTHRSAGTHPAPD